MARTTLTGPIVVQGGDSSNPDEFAPNTLLWGVMQPDPRNPQLLSGVAQGWLDSALYITIDQAPSAIATANIAALANVTSGTAMTLVSSSGAGITVTTSATVINQTGLTVASGALIIDVAPGSVSPSQTGNIQILDPTKSIGRAVSITGVASGTGGNFLVTGNDIYGVPTTELVTATAGATTANGKKAFKFIRSVVPQFTDAHNYSIGTADIFGFPLFSNKWAYTKIYWNSALITANTGYLAGVTTSPATTTTGDVRGTYAVQSASDGTKTLQVFQSVAVANASSTTGLIGVTQV